MAMNVKAQLVKIWCGTYWHYGVRFLSPFFFPRVFAEFPGTETLAERSDLIVHFSMGKNCVSLSSVEEFSGGGECIMVHDNPVEFSLADFELRFLQVLRDTRMYCLGKRDCATTATFLLEGREYNTQLATWYGIGLGVLLWIMVGRPGLA